MLVSPNIKVGQVLYYLYPALQPVSGNSTANYNTYSSVQYSKVQYSTVQLLYLDTVFRVKAPPVTITVAEEGSGMEQARLDRQR